MVEMLRRLKAYVKVLTEYEGDLILQVQRAASGVLMTIAFAMGVLLITEDSVECVAEPNLKGYVTIEKVECWRQPLGLNAVSNFRVPLRLKTSMLGSEDLLGEGLILLAPVFIFVQMLARGAPLLAWELMGGNDLNNLAFELCRAELVYMPVRRQKLRDVIRAIELSQENHYAFKFFLGKSLSLAVGLLQLSTTDFFMNGKFALYGWKVLVYKMGYAGEGVPDAIDAVFPRGLLCSVLGKEEDIYASCVFASNVLLARVFFVLWWFFVLQIVASAVSLLFLVLSFTHRARIAAIRSMCVHYTYREVKLITDCLGVDGCLFLSHLVKNIPAWLIPFIKTRVATYAYSRR